MKRHFIILFILLALLNSCNLPQTNQLSEPLDLTINLNTILGLSQEAKSSFSQIFSETTGKEPKMKLVIDGQPVTLKVTVSLHKDSDNSVIETISKTSDSTYVNFLFQPILIGEKIYGTLSITEEGETEIMFASQTESTTIVEGDNILSIPLNPPFFLYQYTNWATPEVIRDEYTKPTNMQYYKTNFPATASSSVLKDPNINEPIVITAYYIGPDHTTYIISREPEDPDEPSLFSNYFLYTVDADGKISEYTYPTALMPASYSVVDLFMLNETLYILAANVGYQWYHIVAPTNSYSSTTYDAEGSPKITNLPSTTHTSITFGGNLHATVLDNQIYLLGTDSANQKYLLPVENTSSEGDEEESYTIKDDYYISNNPLQENLNLSDEIVLDGDPTYTKRLTTDFVTFNNTLVALTKVTTEDIFEDVPGYAAEHAYRSFGYISVIDPTFYSTTIIGVPNNLTTNSGDILNTDGPFAPTTPDKNELFGPDRVVAITTKRLFIADDGFYFEDLDDSHYPKVGNINRIVTVDLDFSINSLFLDTDLQFSNSAHTIPLPEGSSACGEWVLID